MAVETNGSRALAKEWMRKLLTVLIIARKEEAKGGRLPPALDLFVKDVKGESTSAREDGFDAHLERSVKRTARYLDGRSKSAEVAPGVSCKDVENEIHGLLERMGTPAVIESSCPDPPEVASIVSQTGVEAVEIEHFRGSGDESDEATVERGSPPERKLSSNSTGSPKSVGGGESVPVRAVDALDTIEASSPQASPNRVEKEPTEPEPLPSKAPAFSSPYESRPNQMQVGPYMVPLTVAARPLCIGGVYSVPLNRIYRMPCVKLSPPGSRTLVPASQSGGLLFAVPLLAPDTTREPQQLSRHTGHSNDPRPKRLPTPDLVTAPGTFVPVDQDPASLATGPNSVSADHPSISSSRSVEQVTGAGTFWGHSTEPESVEQHGSPRFPPPSPAEPPAGPGGLQTSGLMNDSQSTGRSCGANGSMATPPLCDFEYPQQPGSSPQRGSPVLPPPSPSEPPAEPSGLKISASSDESERTDQSYGTGSMPPSLVPPPLSHVQLPATGPTAPVVAAAPEHVVLWSRCPAHPAAGAAGAAPGNHRPTRPITGVEPTAGRGTFSAYPQGPGSAPRQGSQVVCPPSPLELPTGQGGLQTPASPDDLQHKDQIHRPGPMPPPLPSHVQLPVTGPAPPVMATAAEPSVPWSRYIPYPAAAVAGAVPGNHQLTRTYTTVEPTAGGGIFCGYPQEPGLAPRHGSPALSSPSRFELPTGSGGFHVSGSPDDSQRTARIYGPGPIPPPLPCHVQLPVTGPAPPAMTAAAGPSAPWGRYAAYTAAGVAGAVPRNHRATGSYTGVGQTAGGDVFCGYPQEPGLAPQPGSPDFPPASPFELPTGPRGSQTSGYPNNLQRTGWGHDQRVMQPPPGFTRPPALGPAAPAVVAAPTPFVPVAQDQPYPAARAAGAVPGNIPAAIPFSNVEQTFRGETFCGHPREPGFAMHNVSPGLFPTSPSEVPAGPNGLQTSGSPYDSRQTGCTFRPMSMQTPSPPPSQCNLQSPVAGPAPPVMATAPGYLIPWGRYPAYPVAGAAGPMLGNRRPSRAFTGVTQTADGNVIFGYPQEPRSAPQHGSPAFAPPPPFELPAVPDGPQRSGSPDDCLRAGWSHDPRPTPSPPPGLTHSPALGPAVPGIAAAARPFIPLVRDPAYHAAGAARVVSGNYPVAIPPSNVDQTVRGDKLFGYPQEPGSAPDHGSPVLSPFYRSELIGPTGGSYRSSFRQPRGKSMSRRQDGMKCPDPKPMGDLGHGRGHQNKSGARE